MNILAEAKLNFIEMNGLGPKDFISYAITVGPDQARQWLEENKYPKQRNLSRKHVDGIKDSIEKDIFPDGTQIYFGVCDGKEYLLDGQHRLTAIVETGKSQTMSVAYKQVTEYKHLAFLYATFDRPRVRGFGDTSEAFCLSERTGIPAKQIHKAKHAISLILKNFSFYGDRIRSLSTEFEVMDLIELYYQEHIKTYYSFLSGSDQKLKDAMVRRSTMAVALVTLDESGQHISRNRVCEFWQKVIDATSLEKNDPRLRLHDKLLATRISGGTHTRGSGEHLTPVEALRLVVVAWNAYVINKPIARFSLPSDEPLPIKFTSYTVPVER